MQKCRRNLFFHW